MALFHSLDVALGKDEILERLPLTTPAFSARPAPALVEDLLNRIEQERLITPRASYDFHEIGSVDGHCIELDDDSLQINGALPGEVDQAENLVFAAWTLGSDISSAASQTFAQRQYLAGLLLHEIASLLLFRLGEILFEKIALHAAGREQNVGRVMAPGDGILDLSAQGTVLARSRAGRVGIAGGVGGPLIPLKSATAVAAAGRSITMAGSRWSCQQCRVRDHCRLRRGPTESRKHGRLC